MDEPDAKPEDIEPDDLARELQADFEAYVRRQEEGFAHDAAELAERTRLEVESSVRQQFEPKPGRLARLGHQLSRGAARVQARVRRADSDALSIDVDGPAEDPSDPASAEGSHGA